MCAQTRSSRCGINAVYLCEHASLPVRCREEFLLTINGRNDVTAKLHANDVGEFVFRVCGDKREVDARLCLPRGKRLLHLEVHPT